ncbi:ribbon-helix-helix domain-containing protein [Methylotenera sp. L2L1]|nr:ribbon-helix-helix domain-containing protein [Methylotenera sp. L2L1]
MSTMNISLPEPLKKFIDERVANAGYGTHLASICER